MKLIINRPEHVLHVHVTTKKATFSTTRIEEQYARSLEWDD